MPINVIAIIVGKSRRRPLKVEALGVVLGIITSIVGEIPFMLTLLSCEQVYVP